MQEEPSAVPYNTPEKAKAHYKANRERLLAANAAWRKANRERVSASKKAWHEANRERVRAAHAVWREANRERCRARDRKRNRLHPEWRAFIKHRSVAKQRDLEFLLTFEEWLAIWHESGKWAERGCRKGQYCMARFGDKGPYAVGNVRICTNAENHAEWNIHRILSDETRKRMSDAAKMRKARSPISEETRKRLSDAAKASWAWRKR